ncbi:MAG TPA: hypothetical protein VEU62_11885 [Bryobacterales bacterium]|nr:hypothetical protein [Bryobacterales bacterium]
MNPDIGTLDMEIKINPRKHQHPRAGRASASKQPAASRIPRITRLMALPIKFQEMVDRGEVRDYADLARLGYVSRARMTQIMNLLNLAPQLQENIVLDPEQVETISESLIREITGLVLWQDQLNAWEQVGRRARRAANSVFSGCTMSGPGTPAEVLRLVVQKGKAITR